MAKMALATINLSLPQKIKIDHLQAVSVMCHTCHRPIMSTVAIRSEWSNVEENPETKQSKLKDLKESCGSLGVCGDVSLVVKLPEDKN